MTDEQLLDYVKHVLNYIKSDIDSYNSQGAINRIGAGPYILTTCSGIDLFGALAVPETELSEKAKETNDLKRKSAAGSKWYIKKYMGKVKNDYKNPDISKSLYHDLRCGQVHEGIVKAGLLIGLNHEKYHLQLLSIRESSRSNDVIKVFFIDTCVFANDFLESTEHFIHEIAHDDVLRSRAKDRLRAHIRNANPVNLRSVPEVNIDVTEFGELYNTSSSSPYDPGGFWLRHKLSI